MSEKQNLSYNIRMPYSAAWAMIHDKPQEVQIMEFHIFGEVSQWSATPSNSISVVHASVRWNVPGFLVKVTYSVKYGGYNTELILESGCLFDTKQDLVSSLL